MTHNDLAVGAGVVLGLGLVWLLVDLWMHYYARSGLDPGYALAKPTASSEEKAAAKKRSFELQHRQLHVMERLRLPVAVLMAVALVVVIIAALV